MKIAVIASKVTAVTSAMADELAARGATVRIICPENELIELSKIRVEDDLYVLKSVGHLGLGLAGALHAAGARTLNPYPAVALVKHKVAVSQVLHAGGVPVPETFTTTDPERLLPILAQYPLIAKPFDGARSDGIKIIRTPEDLSDTKFSEFLMVQRYCEPDENDRFVKAYYLDGRIFVTKRRWSESDRRNKMSEPFNGSVLLDGIVRNCANVLKLKLFGLDIVISQGRPYVVDVGSFGSLMGIPGAPAMVADRIIRAWEEAKSVPPA